VQRPIPAGPVAAAEPAAPTASELFRVANDARHARRDDEAIRLYRDLQSAYPTSPEARLSFLSVGDLNLARGASHEALAAFNAYLATDAPELWEEATLGKAQALARLHRSEDERTVWQALLARNPSSEYRWRARQRLDELRDLP
jgi:outer membrane protein assembly factor BamD (BamD/ComL family)